MLFLKFSAWFIWTKGTQEGTGLERKEQRQPNPGGWGKQGVPAERKVTNSRMKHSSCFPLPGHSLPVLFSLPVVEEMCVWGV